MSGVPFRRESMAAGDAPPACGSVAPLRGPGELRRGRPVCDAPERADLSGISQRLELARYRRLLECARELFAEREPERLLDRLQRALAEFVPHDSGRIFLAGDEGRLLVPVRGRPRGA